MQKYYKIVSWNCVFKRRYKIEDNYGIIPETRFVAKEPLYTEDYMLIRSKPVLHFACGELNALLWYEVFEYGINDIYPPVQETCIYEIQPKGHVYKGITKDMYQLYQYGANVIQCKERIRVSQIVESAIKKYEETEPYIHNDDLRKKIKQWQILLHDTELWRQYLEDEYFDEKPYN